MASDYLRRERPWESPQRSRSTSREREVIRGISNGTEGHHHHNHNLPHNTIPMDPLQALHRGLGVEESLRRISSSQGREMEYVALGARQKRERAGSSPALHPVPPPVLVQNDSEHLRLALLAAEQQRRAAAEMQTERDDNARLRNEVDRLRRALEALNTEDLPPRLSADDSTSTEVLIDSIKSAFLREGRKHGVASSIAEQLKKTEKKIGLLTQENLRLQGKLERAVKAKEEQKQEVLRLRGEVRERGGDEAVMVKEMRVDATREGAALLEMKTEENARLRLELRAAKEELRRPEDVAAQYDVEMKRLQNTLEVAEARCHTLDAAHTACQRELRAATTDAAGASASTTALQAEIRVLQAKNEDLIRENAKSTAQHQSVHHEFQTIERELRDSRSATSTQIRSKEDELARIRTDAANKDAEIASLLAKVKRMEEGSRVATTASADVEVSYKQKVQQLETEREGYFGRNKDLERINAQLQHMNTDLDARLEQARSSLLEATRVHEAGLRQKDTHHENETAELKRKLCTLELDLARRSEDSHTEHDAKVATYQSNLTAATAEALSLKEKTAKLDALLSREKESYEKAKLEHTTVLAGKSREIDLLHMSKQQEVAVLQSRLEQEQQKNQDLMTLTESKHTFIIDENHSLKLDKTRLVEQNRSLTEAHAALKEETRAAAQTALEAASLLAQEKAQRVEAEANAKNAREQLDELRHLVAKKETEVRELLRGLQQQTDTTTQANSKRNDLEAQLREMELNAQKERTGLELLDRQRYSELSELKTRNQKYEDQLHAAQKGLADMESLYNEQQRTVQEMLRERQDEHRNVLEPLREKADAQRAELHKLRDKNALLEKQVDTQRVRNDGLNAELTEANVKRAALASEYKDQQRCTESAEALRREAQGKLSDQNTRAYDEQLSLSAQLQSLEKELSLHRAKMSDADTENRRLATELEDAHQQLHSLRHDNASSKTLLDRIPFLELRIQEATQQAEFLRAQGETTADRNTALIAEIDMKDQAASDRMSEIKELRSSLDTLKATCAQHEKEAAGRMAERRASIALEVSAVSPAVSAPSSQVDTAEVAQLSAANATLQRTVSSLETALAEERQRCEQMSQDVRTKSRIAEEKEAANTRALQAAKHSLTEAVHMQSTLLAKIADFVRDAGGGDDGGALVARCAAVTAEWRQDASTWDAGVAQDLCTQLLSTILRRLATLK